jgi:hypothetical protein
LHIRPTGYVDDQVAVLLPVAHHVHCSWPHSRILGRDRHTGCEWPVYAEYYALRLSRDDRQVQVCVRVISAEWISKRKNKTITIQDIVSSIKYYYK